MATPNLAIAHIASNQTQKEVTANTAFDDFDTTLTGLVSINMAGGVDVTPSQASIVWQVVLQLTGAITANINLILPAAKHWYVVQNNTTGAFTITVKTSAGGSTGVTIYTGDVVLLYSDGTNVTKMQALKAVVENEVVCAISSGAVTIDASQGNTFRVPLTANVTSVTINNPRGGQVINIKWVQDATGSRTVTATPLKGLTAPSAGANSVSAQSFVYDSTLTNWYALGTGSTGM